MAWGEGRVAAPQQATGLARIMHTQPAGPGAWHKPCQPGTGKPYEIVMFQPDRPGAVKVPLSFPGLVCTRGQPIRPPGRQRAEAV